ncbi:hypothetical protein HDZ31DRAFT_77850 [Schizophyllum fasciatum]
MTEVIHIEPAGLGSRLEPIPPVGYLSRKALPIKRNDAEPLTREDIQYDLLYHIFKDNQSVFTNQVPGKFDKVTFRQLYVNALYHSSKCSKVLKDKMLDTPEFAVEFAKIALLTNVGRINTTMAFFPEMKTALRTYHPVPSLQKTDGNAQDAPRIKNCLKSALLPSEVKKPPPSNPAEIISRYMSGMRPPTSVVNLIFVLSTHAALSQTLSRTHFDGNINFLDLFIPTNLSSPDRARAFLFVMFYYLESPTGEVPNPFGDELSAQDPAKAPRMRVLSQADARRENVDPPEEVEWGLRMSAQRNLFLQKLVSTDTENKKSKDNPYFISGAPEPGPSARREAHGNLVKAGKDGPFMYYVPRRAETERPEPIPVPEVDDDQGIMEQPIYDVPAPPPPVPPPVPPPEPVPRKKDRFYTRRLNLITRLRGRPPTPEAAYSRRPMRPVNNGTAYRISPSSRSSYSSRSRGNSYSAYETPAPRPPPPILSPPAVLRTPSTQRTPSPMDEDEDAEPDYTSPYGADVRSRYLPRAPPYAMPTAPERRSTPAAESLLLKNGMGDPHPHANGKSPSHSAPAYNNGYWHR